MNLTSWTDLQHSRVPEEHPEPPRASAVADARTGSVKTAIVRQRDERTS